MKYFLSISIICFIFACKPKQPENKNTTVSKSIPTDFIEFYKRFHANSDFQLSHILFPLEGLPANADSLDFADGQFKWQKEDWKIHKALDENNKDFKREWIPLGDYTIIEKITQTKQGFTMQRRFYKQSDGWYLIYYAAMNRAN